MNDTAAAAHDDAPATAAKSRPSDPATDALGTKSGDSLIGRAVTINRDRSDVFDYWRDLTRLPEFMENVERIDRIDGNRTHWFVKAPAGRTVEWVALITEYRDGELIAWETEPGADVLNAGRVEFREVAGRGTVVTLTIAYDPPGGVVGKVIAKLFQREPAIQARRDLRRLKQLMETGEIATGSRNHREYEERG